nr:cytochrome c biogenesis protein ResB [Desulfobulbaceae bacterium]
MFSLLGLVIPQTAFRSQGYFESLKSANPFFYRFIDLLQLNHVFSSIPFLIIIFLLYLSLFITLWEQWKKQLRFLHTNKKSVPVGLKEDSISFQVTNNAREAIPADIKQVMAGYGFTCQTELTEHDFLHLVFAKHMKSRWGVFIFHLGLFILLNAAIYGLFKHQRGFVPLMEGETFIGQDGDWLVPSNGPLAERLTFPFNVRLNKFKVAYWDNDQEQQMHSQLLFSDDNGNIVSKNEISVSSPIEHGGVSFHQSQDFGYALTFALHTNDAKPIVSHFILDAVGDKSKPLTGKSDYPNTGYIFKMRFFPDISRPSFSLIQPGVDLTILENKDIQFEGRLLLGQTINFDDNILTFLDVRPWSGIIAIRGYVLPGVYLSFLLIVIGMVLMYLLPTKQIYIGYSCSGNGCQFQINGKIGGRTPCTHFELEQIKQTLIKALA